MKKLLQWGGVGVFLVGILFSGVAQAQVTTCGDIIEVDQFTNEEFREEITDCDDPFGLIDGTAVTAISYERGGDPVVDGAVLYYESLPAALGITSTFVTEALFLDPFDQLYYHEGLDYRLLTNGPGANFVTATGTYTLVTSIEELPQLSQAWPQRIFAWLVPTAYAQFGFLPVERTAVTFTVALLPIEPEPTGASSVLFLPGIQASRLYKDGLFGSEDRLWEPNSSGDVRDLSMDQSGISFNNIYTRDPIDKIFGVGANIYEGLLVSLDGLERDGVIKDYEPFAYDWRYSVFDVVRDSVQYKNESKLLLDELLRLAEDSYTGKVTIIAHSNGGLVAKALLVEYGQTVLVGKIDKLIMVGTPETGAPKAIASLLHGYDQGTPANLIINDSTIRGVSKNIPGTYGLLPSATYFTNNPVPVIFFDASDSTAVFRSQYGNAVNGLDELSEFMNGIDGRLEAEDTSAASLSNPGLLAVAQFQAQVLDALEFDNEIDVYSVVGTGKETEVAFEYREFTERVCETEFLTEICTNRIFYRPVPILSLAGDETVPSGSFITGQPHYVDISGTDYEHKNLTESPEIQSFILEVIIATGTVETNSQAPVYSREQLLIGLHSPMEIVITDEQSRQSGDKNGEIVLDIPNTTHRELAGARYITIPKDESFTVQLQGTANGGATLTIDEFSGTGFNQIATLPLTEISASTNAIIEFNQEFTNLRIDFDGDGTTDVEVGLDGVIIENASTYETLKNSILDLDLSPKKERRLLKTVSFAERYNKHDSKRAKKLERRALRFLKPQLKWFRKKGIITRTEFVFLKDQIKTLIAESKK